MRKLKRDIIPNNRTDKLHLTMWNVAYIIARRQHSKFIHSFFSSARLIAYKQIPRCDRFGSNLPFAKIVSCSFYETVFIRKLCVYVFFWNSAKRRCQKFPMKMNAQWKTTAIDSCGKRVNMQQCFHEQIAFSEACEHNSEVVSQKFDKLPINLCTLRELGKI